MFMTGAVETLPETLRLPRYAAASFVLNRVLARYGLLLSNCEVSGGATRTPFAFLRSRRGDDAAGPPSDTHTPIIMGMVRSRR